MGWKMSWHRALAVSTMAEIPVFSIVGPAILLVSALLTAGYLLPIALHGFFPVQEELVGYSQEQGTKQQIVEMENGTSKHDVPKWRELVCLYMPLCVFVAGAVLLGMFPAGLIEQVQNIITGLF